MDTGSALRTGRSVKAVNGTEVRALSGGLTSSNAVAVRPRGLGAASAHVLCRTTALRVAVALLVAQDVLRFQIFRARRLRGEDATDTGGTRFKITVRNTRLAV